MRAQVPPFLQVPGRQANGLVVGVIVGLTDDITTCDDVGEASSDIDIARDFGLDTERDVVDVGDFSSDPVDDTSLERAGDVGMDTGVGIDGEVDLSFDFKDDPNVEGHVGNDTEANVVLDAKGLSGEGDFCNDTKDVDGLDSGTDAAMETVGEPASDVAKDTGSVDEGDFSSDSVDDTSLERAGDVGMDTDVGIEDEVDFPFVLKDDTTIEGDDANGTEANVVLDDKNFCGVEDVGSGNKDVDGVESGRDVAVGTVGDVGVNNTNDVDPNFDDDFGFDSEVLIGVVTAYEDITKPNNKWL